MKSSLKCELWSFTLAQIQKCHLSLLNGDSKYDDSWNNAFNNLIVCIRNERKFNDSFAVDISFLTEETGISYDFVEIFEEYFDYLENNKEWDLVVVSAYNLLDTFIWKKTKPSEYLFRIGNAYLQENKLEEAQVFGKRWLEKYPNDLYGVASNAFLLAKLGKEKEALELTNKYLPDDLRCNNEDDSLFLAATRLFELTDDPYAKERINKKIFEYNNK